MDQFVISQLAPGHASLTCRGDLDLLARPDLGAACAEALGIATRRLVVDIDGVDFLDCGSVRLLDQTAALQASQGGEFRVVCSDDFLLRVLKLTGFSARHETVAGQPTPRTEQLSWRARARPSARRAVG
jgi:anti-anti-sigma factor